MKSQCRRSRPRVCAQTSGERRIPHAVEATCRSLGKVYDLSRLGNKRNGLDEYLYILLSLRTHEKGFSGAYKGFKRAFPSWQDARSAGARQIAKAIGTGGLARQKAQRIKAALKMIDAELGEVSLRKLRRMSQEEAEGFLVRLPGVGLKSARCIMMYSLGLPVLPVDTHVARIAYRLGWVPKTNSQMLHDLLERIVPPKLRFSFHVYCVQHGRKVCRSQYPQCCVCCLAKSCPRVGVPGMNKGDSRV